MGEDKTDSFDDLFEPFELEDSPPAEPVAPAAPPPPQRAAQEEAVPVVACPSCGTANPNYNRHCEACGARLGKGPLPVAPPPMVRATPGGRALGVLAAVVLVVALVALVINIIRDDPTPEAATTVATAPSSTVVQPVQELNPSGVEASSTLNATYAAENLLDGDPATEWQDQGLRGEGATLTFEFAQPVAIEELEIRSLADDARFKQNYRIRGYKIIVDDLPFEISGQLEDDNRPQRVAVATLNTRVLTMEVTSTFAAEASGDRPPYNELALADVRFFGRLSQ